LARGKLVVERDLASKHDIVQELSCGKQLMEQEVASVLAEVA
jgi:hypothetical protein